MTASQFLTVLRQRGVKLSADEFGDLCFKAPKGVITEPIAASLRRYKMALLEILCAEEAEVATHAMVPNSRVIDAAELFRGGKYGDGAETEEPVCDPFDGASAEDLVRPFTDLLNAALDGELPDVVVPFPCGGRVLRPNAAVVGYAKEMLAWHERTDEEAKAAASLYMDRLAYLALWWDGVQAAARDSREAVGSGLFAAEFLREYGAAKDAARAQARS